MHIRNLLLIALVTALLLQFAQSQALAQGALWGRYDEETGTTIGFRVVRNNVPGADFNLIVTGECTYDNSETAPNTFSFSGDALPDLLLRRNGHLNAEFEAESDTGHVGTLSIDCRFSGNNEGRRNFKRARCTVMFDAPVIPDVQLDSCIAGASISRIRKSQS